MISLARSALTSRALVAAGVAIGLSACGVVNTSATRTVGGSGNSTATQINGEYESMGHQSLFQLDILNGSWDSLRLGYDLQPAWAALQRAYASTAAFTITEEDVESYNWSGQVMTLTPQSSQALISKFARNEEERAYPEAALDQRAFVVVLSGSPVYGGIFLHPMSSMGISFPVIYAASAEGKLTFTLRPVQSVLGDYASVEPDWNGIKNQKIREVFAKAGKLVPR